MKSQQEQSLEIINAELEKQLAEKNRDLQIEASLERVRTVAMSMRKPADLLSICESLFRELQLLDFGNLRNALVHTYLNSNYIIDYDYSDFSKGTINHIPYSGDPILEEFVKGIRKTKDAFIEEALTGLELENWKKFRNANNEAYDERLDKTQALYYYFYSVGEAAIGISTFLPISAEKLEVLKRFRNVFDLAYRRFADIQLAEAQARESKIELALERVRARAMAMQNSGELAHLVTTLFNELGKLDMTFTRCMIWLMEHDVSSAAVWMADPVAEKAFLSTFKFVDIAYHKSFIEAWKERKQQWIYELEGEEKRVLNDLVFSMPGTANTPEEIKQAMIASERVTLSFSFSNFGGLQVDGDEPLSSDNLAILGRFAKVFDQTYTRFSDLKQAEAQARESKIELALERVRARTMAMQHSDELSETVYILFQQFKELGENPDQATIGVINEEEKVIEYWVTMYGSQINKVFKFPIDEPHVTQKIYQGWKAKKTSLVIDLSGKDLYTFTKFRESMGGAKHNPNEKRRVINVAFFSKGLINVQSSEARSAESVRLLERFAAVFDGTYTRFLDLQKAEAQVREAQIEAALERTRTQSMIMQHSSELDDTLRVFHQQVVLLGIRSAFSFLWLPDEEKDRHIFWAAWAENNSNNFKSKAIDYPLDRNEPATAQCLIDWKGNDPVVSYHVPPEGVVGYFAAWQELIDGVEQLKPEYFQGGLYYVEAFMKYGCFGVMVEKSLSPEEIKILGRFAIEFERTYTRFLDLKRAEAQARLAQIELSLERVRAKTMAMHNSEHVGETVLTMFDELVKLGIEKTVRCGILIIDETKHMEVWTAVGDANGKVQMRIGRIDMMIHPLLSGIHEAWKNKEQIRRYELAGDDLKIYYQAINNSPEYTAKFDLEHLPERETNYAFLFPEGAIFAFTLSPLRDNEMNLFKRFSGVFSQTYRRYLDLQRAEKQARQARIEAALERVRSRSMGMQKSDELKEIIKVVFEQLDQLEIPAEHAGFIMDYPTNENMNIWLADKHFDPSWVSIPYFDSPHWNSFKDAIANGKDFFVNYLNFEEKNKFYRELFDIVPGVTDEAKAYYFNCPALAVSTVLLENVGLYIENFSGVPFTDEENATLMRFGKVFQQTYTRFLDLQKAEAQGREAIKQASLDRVRGEIASMRSTEDLDRITPLIWNELMILGIPFIRCGVFIIDEEAELIYAHLSTADGKAISTFKIRFDSSGIGTQISTAWRAKQVTTVHWSAEEFADYTQSLVNQGTITSSDKYVTEHPDISLDLHFLPFLQGMLYVGNIEPLTRDEIELVQALADAFSTAYARYEDFNKLESAKKQVENTLNDLKAAQTKLIQSEKMASLGELTAGIAHEIQNPLNFVNNFSEVNQEILAELKAETEKPITERDAQLEIELISDLLDNEQKINHHGKRADAIVKGMLQHSRTGGGEKQLININALADEFMRLSYHGLRAKDKIFNAVPIAIGMVTHFDPDLPKINGIGQDLGRVLLNLFNNAFYAVNQKKQNLGGDYKPEVTVTTLTENGQVVIKVKDNGVGMPEHIKEKIMQPFFTTKPTGEGTGLGLSLTYDMVVKGHGGKIDVNTKEGEFTEFIVSLPI